MLATLALGTILLAPLQLAGGTPAPPGCVVDADLTKAAADRVALETRQALAQIDADLSMKASEKAELKRKVSRLKVQVCTCSGDVESVVAFYQEKMQAAFITADRDILHDVRELARTEGFRIDPAVEKEWQGKSGRASRWNRFDGTLEIDVEEYLIDPRTGQVSKKTVLMVTAVED
jgi:hypothetical protein